MKKYNKTSCYRAVKTTNEIRQYYAHKDLVRIRAKRNPHNIPNAYDDVNVNYEKTWKHKRKTQYHNRSEKTKFTVELDSLVREWLLEEYFEKYNIPFRIERIRKTIIRQYRKTISVPGPLVPQYTYSWKPEKKHQIGWAPAYYKYVETDEVYEAKYYITTGYIITYWADKELDLSKILLRNIY